MSLIMLRKNGKTDSLICPDCGRDLEYEEGGAVRIVDGHLDMDNIKARQICRPCGKFYREVMKTGYYDVSELAPEKKVSEKKFPGVKQEQHQKLKNVGDIPPMQLKKDSNGQCTCPRCGDKMDFIEGQPVHLVEGRPDMEDVWPHFHCSHCSSIFRRIATTDYYQFAEK